MSTMVQAVRAYVESVEGAVTTEQIKRYINAEFPGQWKESTLQAHLYACVVNNPKAYVHHPYIEKFLYRNTDGTFELYSEQVHGPNEWAPDISGDEASDVSELVETSISLERDIEDHLVHHLETIEVGMELVGRQIKTDIGRIDILAIDSRGLRVIIEIKVGDAKDSAIGQIARYLGWYTKTEGNPARGILIASNFPEGVQYAAAAIPNLTLMSYRIHFSFETVKV